MISIYENTNYDAVAEELYKAIKGEREASKALLHHALEAVGKLQRLLTENHDLKSQQAMWAADKVLFDGRAAECKQLLADNAALRAQLDAYKRREPLVLRLVDVSQDAAAGCTSPSVEQQTRMAAMAIYEIRDIEDFR